nr:dTDP-4-dehydrorhamnose 3,5-epimerase family protein [Paracoccus saliphilus]
MIREPLEVDGAFILHSGRNEDDRGWFSRLFSARDFMAAGVPFAVEQVNCALSARRGTLRGLHYQVAPFAEAKLLTCKSGALFDVVVDVRESSPTFGRWSGITLEAGDRRLVFVPPGCAHGTLSLAPASESLYLTSNSYSQAHERIVRWNDPAFGIDWPITPAVLSDKDRVAPNFAIGAQTLAPSIP